MKRNAIILLCAIALVCSGTISTYASTCDSQVTTEQSPREGRTVKDAGNRPTRTPRTEKKSERKSPRENSSNTNSNSNSNSKSNPNNQSRFNSNTNYKK